MKKLLSIIVLGLLLSGNAYAKNITILFSNEKELALLSKQTPLSNKVFHRANTAGVEHCKKFKKYVFKSKHYGVRKTEIEKYYISKGYKIGKGFSKKPQLQYFVCSKTPLNYLPSWASYDVGNEVDYSNYGDDSVARLIIKDIKDKHIAKKPKDNSIISKDSIPNIKNSEWKTTQKIGGNPRGMFFFSDGSCKYTDSSTDCEWTQNASKLKFNFGKAFYTVNLSGEKWNGSAHNNKINRSWKSFGEAVFVEDWIKISYVPKDEKPKPSPDDNKVVAAGSGSGFFVSKDGHIITNHHVVDGCKTTKVNFRGSEIEAKVLSIDKVNDIAILKTNINPNNIFPVSNEDVSLLEDVVVAGYPKN